MTRSRPTKNPKRESNAHLSIPAQVRGISSKQTNHLRPNRFLKSLNILLNWLFLFLTLLSIAYLVFDRIYETSATITTPVPHAINPFTFLFSITNNNHLFEIRNLVWGCRADYLDTTLHDKFTNSTLGSGIRRTIPPGGILNIDCNKNGSVNIMSGGGKVIKGRMSIKISYDAIIFRILPWHISPPATKFTLFTEGINPRWVRGEFAQ